METPVTRRLLGAAGFADGLIRLLPFTPDYDVEPLFAALADPRVWTHIPGGMPVDADDLQARMLLRLDKGNARETFVVCEGFTPVGTTSFLECGDPDVVEIGGTYLTPRVWGTGLNGRIKALLIDAAFEAGCTSVRLRCDEANVRSAAAILKLGAIPDGVVNEGWHRPDGSVRITQFFRLYPEARTWVTHIPEGLVS